MKRIVFSLAILAMGMKLLAQTPISYYPLNQAKNINFDTHLIIEFDSEVKAGNKGIISIIDKTTRKVVDRIDMSISAVPTEGLPKNPAAIYTPIPYIYKVGNITNRNRYRRWTIDDLVDACSDALYDMEGITKGISKRTVQGDIQMMRSDKLGYNAPIESYRNGYYRYSDPNYSISDVPLSDEDYVLVVKTIKLIGKYNEKGELSELGEALLKVKDKLGILLRCG